MSEADRAIAGLLRQLEDMNPEEVKEFYVSIMRSDLARRDLPDSAKLAAVGLLRTRLDEFLHEREEGVDAMKRIVNTPAVAMVSRGK